MIHFTELVHIARRWFFQEDPTLDLRLGAWFPLAGLVRVQLMTSSQQPSSSSSVTSSAGQKEVEYVASPGGKFLQTYFRRVADQLHRMQKERNNHYFPVQYFAKVRVRVQ